MPFIESEGVTGHEEGRARPLDSVGLALVRHRDCAYSAEDGVRLLDSLCQYFRVDGEATVLVRVVPRHRIADLFRHVVDTLNLECVVLPFEEVSTSVMSAFTRDDSFRDALEVFSSPLYYHGRDDEESLSRDGVSSQRDAEPRVTMRDVVRGMHPNARRFFVDCATAGKLPELRRFLMIWYVRRVVGDVIRQSPARDKRAWRFSLLFTVTEGVFINDLMNTWAETVSIS